MCKDAMAYGGPREGEAFRRVLIKDQLNLTEATMGGLNGCKEPTLFSLHYIVVKIKVHRD